MSVYNEEWRIRALNVDAYKRGSDGEWPETYTTDPVTGVTRSHDKTSNGHQWKYFGGEWKDTIRQCLHCGKKMYFFRCWSDWNWIDTPWHIKPGYMEAARYYLPQFFEKKCPANGGIEAEVSNCPKATGEENGKI